MLGGGGGMGMITSIRGIPGGRFALYQRPFPLVLGFRMIQVRQTRAVLKKTQFFPCSGQP